MLITNPEILLGIILTPQVVIFTQLPYYLHIHNIEIKYLPGFCWNMLKTIHTHTHTQVPSFGPIRKTRKTSFSATHHLSFLPGVARRGSGEWSLSQFIIQLTKVMNGFLWNCRIYKGLLDAQLCPGEQKGRSKRCPLCKRAVKNPKHNQKPPMWRIILLPAPTVSASSKFSVCKVTRGPAL